MAEEKSFSRSKSVEQTVQPKDVKYPQIFEVAKSLTNKFWSDVLTDLSKGRCPKKCGIDDETVSFLSKKTKDVVYYKTKTVEELAEILPKMLHTHCGIFSNEDQSRDMVNVNYQLDAFVKATEFNDWRKVNNKNMKRDLLTDWVIRQKEEQNLKPSVARKLHKMVHVGFFVLHTHGADDVVMEDSKIASINGIEISDGIVCNTKLQTKIDEAARSVEEEVDKRKTAGDKWINYLKGMTDLDITC